jgi:Domain of unknown function (DUF1844)
MSKKQEQEFVVSDRRRFGSEGDLRTDVAKREDDAPVIETPPAATPPATNQAAPASPGGASKTASPEADATESSARLIENPEGAEESAEMPEPPTAEEQREQHDAYKASGKTLDSIFQSKLGAQGAYPEMTFEKVIESLYMSALIQMGAIRQEGETQPQIDIIGARQTIDSVTVLQEKTKGNLNDRENTLLQNVLFELRMAWIELTNAIAARAANPPSGVVPPSGVIPGTK